MAGFATIAREESDVDAKNTMLEYLADLKEDAHDFSWASAKGSHAVLLCKIEEGKVQRFTQQNHAQNAKKKSDSKGMPCKFYQKGTCQYKTDHESDSKFYKHICSVCACQSKEYRHSAKDCRSAHSKMSEALQCCSAKF